MLISYSFFQVHEQRVAADVIDTTLLLLLHPVHGRCTIVHLTYLVAHACIVEDIAL
jgi:hypothetical protein